jgi:hypothetical protein
MTEMTTERRLKRLERSLVGPEAGVVVGEADWGGRGLLVLTALLAVALFLALRWQFDPRYAAKDAAGIARENAQRMAVSLTLVVAFLQLALGGIRHIWEKHVDRKRLGWEQDRQRWDRERYGWEEERQRWDKERHQREAEERTKTAKLAQVLKAIGRGPTLHSTLLAALPNLAGELDDLLKELFLRNVVVEIQAMGAAESQYERK